MQIPEPLRSRLVLWSRLLRQSGLLIVTGLWLLVGAYDLFVAQFLPTGWNAPRLLDLTGTQWTIGLLVIALGSVLEGAFRLSRETDKTLSKETAERERAEERLDNLIAGPEFKLKRAKRMLRDLVDEGTDVRSTADLWAFDTVSFISNCRNWEQKSKSLLKGMCGPKLVQEFEESVPEESRPKSPLIQTESAEDQNQKWQIAMPCYVEFLSQTADNLSDHQIRDDFTPP